MPDDLDRLLSRLADTPDAGSLAGFEDAVLRDLRRRREASAASRALVPVRAASLGLAVVAGVAAGGMAAATTLGETRGFDSFSTSARLAPSTLLEGQR